MLLVPYMWANMTFLPISRFPQISSAKFFFFFSERLLLNDTLLLQLMRKIQIPYENIEIVFLKNEQLLSV